LADPTAFPPTAVAELFASLLGRKVTANPAAPLAPQATPAVLVAEYRSEAGAIEALCLCDASLACSLAAALTMIPAGTAAESAKKGRVEGSLAENFQELMNILATLYNRPERTHVHLRKVHLPGTVLPGEITDAFAILTSRLPIELDIASYAGGRLTFASR